MRHVQTRVAALAIGILVPACENATKTLSAENVRTWSIDGTGIALHDPLGDRLQHVTIAVGEAEPIPITRADEDEGELAIENLLILGPDGASFDPPLILEVPNNAPSEVTVGVTFDPVAGEWYTLPTFVTQDAIFIQVDHFSSVGTVRLTGLGFIASATAFGFSIGGPLGAVAGGFLICFLRFSPRTSLHSPP